MKIQLANPGTIGLRRPPTSDLRSPTSDLRPPISDLRSPTSDLRPPISDLRSPTSDLPPPISHLRSPTSDLRPPTMPHIPAFHGPPYPPNHARPLSQRSAAPSP